MRVASSTPTVEPTTMPARITGKSTTPCRNRVPTTSTNMPTEARMLPRTAVFGEPRARMPRINNTAPTK